MSAVLNFINGGFSPVTSGFSSLVVLYFGLFVLAVFFMLLGSVDAYMLRNSIQVIAIAVFQLVTIIHVNAYKACVNNYIGITRSGNNLEAQYRDIWQLEKSECPFRTVNKVNATSFFVIGDPTTSTPANISRTMESNIANLDRAQSLSVAILIFMVLFASIGVFVARKSAEVYGWSVYYAQGADIQKRRVLRHYHTFIVLLKFNVYFAIGIVLQMISIVYYSAKVEIAMFSAGATELGVLADGRLVFVRTISAIAGATVFLTGLGYYACGYYGVKRGSKPLMAGFMAMMVLYIVVALNALYQAVYFASFKVAQVWLASFALLQIALCVATIVVAVMCIKDFDKGLPEMAQILGTVVIEGRMPAKPAMELLLEQDEQLRHPQWTPPSPPSPRHSQSAHPHLQHYAVGHSAGQQMRQHGHQPLGEQRQAHAHANAHANAHAHAHANTHAQNHQQQVGDGSVSGVARSSERGVVGGGSHQRTGSVSSGGSGGGRPRMTLD
ncbi:hypothetical protein BC831DRAFT_397972 [Entophlyctis helioformis]|nr:hypothetical protein BC831DRAFT_397972 [Entophlyctis helioformis]